ncbi:hypothetical protein POSPLADRAFT_1062987 [Postia placenta MAD-698-R-SB12]|uniref:Uncharacterized protein n=1 Tax=Postia placenta MAD-698-R-SB12 TaxID=670580 RepID=A0A1X6MIC8_9APHY|nr:hypothetical protein POSPLADRAFT_1062987 [Postia placenta MAD-698-R-SB12]OSX56088.1 hypothetical protein POSPLADRAFT_1062987 [Postia placenta MAD-698-R-SB12]
MQTALAPLRETVGRAAERARWGATLEPRCCLQGNGPAEDVAVSNAPCTMRRAMTQDLPCPRSRSRSTSPGAAAVDGKAREDIVDAAARTAEDLWTPRASKATSYRCQGNDDRQPARARALRARRRTSEIQTQETEAAGNGEDLDQRPFPPRLVYPRILSVHAVSVPRHRTPLPSSYWMHTLRAGTPSIPYSPVPSSSLCPPSNDQPHCASIQPPPLPVLQSSNQGANRPRRRTPSIDLTPPAPSNHAARTT